MTNKKDDTHRYYFKSENGNELGILFCRDNKYLYETLPEFYLYE